MFTGSVTTRTATQSLLCLLGITSLLSTAYMSHLVLAPSSINHCPQPAALPLQDEGPVRRYLPYLNGGVCLLLALAALNLNGKGERGTMAEVFWIWCLVPGSKYLLLKSSILEASSQRGRHQSCGFYCQAFDDGC